MWNIVDQTLLDLFKGSHIKIVGFADDTLLLISGNNILELISTMQKTLDRVIAWGDSKKTLL
jgi:hypothetical protein